MAVKVGINGFGRIGRLALRAMIARPSEFEIVGINDLSPAETMAHLTKYDTVHGRFDGQIEAASDGMVVNGKKIPLCSEKDPAKLPWKQLGAKVVLESTGVFTSRQKGKPGSGDYKAGYDTHLEAGAEYVVLSAPAKDEVDATIVMGVNDGDLSKDHKCVSNASCTTNCLAPVAKVLHENFGIIQGLMTTVHAYTNDQVMLDFVHKDLRRARAGALNIIPTTTGAAKAVGKVLPALNGKLDGFAMRVPVPVGSVVDLTATLEKEASPEQINAAMKKAAEGELKGILLYCDEPIVSSDIIHMPESSVYDALSTITIPKDKGNMCKVVSWYDNEWGYSNRTADLIAKMATL